MKRCPECKRDYYDDSLLYCLDDGAPLLEGPSTSPGADEPSTAILSETASPNEAATRAQIHTTDISGSVLRQEPSNKRFPAKLAAIAFAVLLIVGGGIYGIRYFWGNTKQINSIAVMPFVNVGGNSDIEYLSDGVTESLINNLSELGNLAVKNRSSVFRYKGKDVEPQQIAADLKVQVVLNGRVTQRGDSLTISLDLVDGSTGDQIWGEQYIRKAGDLAALQSEIARDVSQKLRSRLSGAEQDRVVKNQTQNTEAYQLYLQGRYNWNKRTDETTKKAIEFFQQAVAKDPSYAMAYVGLAESYMLSDQSKVKEPALRAIELDPTLGEPHTALGAYHEVYEHDPTTAEQEYRRAIELGPNYATAYHWYGEFLIEQGRWDESLVMWKKALELDPFSLAIGTDYAFEYLYYARKYDEAADYLKKLLEMDPNYPRTHSYLAHVYETTGRYEDAINELAKRFALHGGNAEEIAKGQRELLDAFRTGGPKGYWSKILEFMMQDLKKGNDVSAVELAGVYSELGNRDEAFKWLEKAYQNKNGELAWLKVEPKWDNIRDDLRFKDLLKRLNLPE